MNTFKINGIVTRTGRTVVINRGRIMIDGEDVTPGGEIPTIHVEIVGDVERLDVDVCNEVRVNGLVHSITTQAGDIHCGNVDGSVTTMSGDVRCGEVRGNITTMSGDIKRG